MSIDQAMNEYSRLCETAGMAHAAALIRERLPAFHEAAKRSHRHAIAALEALVNELDESGKPVLIPEGSCECLYFYTQGHFRQVAPLGARTPKVCCARDGKFWDSPQPPCI